MKLTILAFGITKDIVGARTFELELPENATLDNLKQSLTSQFPKFGDLASLRIAVNNEYGNEDVMLKENDEVALIPPVSGA